MRIAAILFAVLLLTRVAMSQGGRGALDAVGGANIKIAKDFKIELLYTVPKATEGSWVSMCLDPKGRLIVGDQNGSLSRVTLPRSAGETVRTERINLDLGGAHGLLWAFQSLYVAVNEGRRTHGVYRVRDTDGDDPLDRLGWQALKLSERLDLLRAYSWSSSAWANLRTP